VRELQTGVWHWEASHPDWKPGEEWDAPSEIDELAAGRETAIVLTCPWHARDARSLAERLGAPLYVPPPDEGDPNPVEGQVFKAGDRLPVGVEAFPGMEPNDLVLWVESRRALVAGDTLIDRGHGLEFRPTGRTRACRPSRSTRRYARCSSRRSSWCFRLTVRRPTEPPSSARSPNARTWTATRRLLGKPAVAVRGRLAARDRAGGIFVPEHLSEEQLLARPKKGDGMSCARKEESRHL
jgi:hypothetical protein